jgi:two-component system response regulator AtoC
MPNGRAHALIVDDDASFQAGLAEYVRNEGLVVTTASDLRQAREELTQNPPDILFLDINLPDGSGLDLLMGADTSGATPETILITGQATVETAVDALRHGVSDYLTKPPDFARVKMILANISRARAMKEEIGGLRGELRELGRFGPLVGTSPAMQKVYDLIGKVAPSDATILITGDTGSGKELVAQTVHQMSPRAREPFVPVNCGAVSPTLIESELFGHERGSFTGADRVHKGYFERANRGTLFLDEITETPLELQVKLLRVLETSTVMRVGGNDTLRVDVRVIAATNRPLEQAVAAGKLREDLLYRLNVFPIHLPTLWERKEDVELLARHFLDGLNKQAGVTREFTRAAIERLRTHRWPGNVRELRNVVQRAFIMAEENISLESLPLGVTGGGASFRGEPCGGESCLHLKVGTSVAEVEHRLILATLESVGGNKKKASELLKISLKTLYNRLSQYRGGP